MSLLELVGEIEAKESRTTQGGEKVVCAGCDGSFLVRIVPIPWTDWEQDWPILARVSKYEDARFYCDSHVFVPRLCAALRILAETCERFGADTTAAEAALRGEKGE